jgi:hypothetical protein
MSRSPKYTVASLVAARAQELAELRRQRKLQRAQREEAARNQRRHAERAAITIELTRLRARADSAAADAAAAGLGDRQRALQAQIDSCAAQTGPTSTDGELRAARKRLGELQCEADSLAVAASGLLTARERGRALAALRALLADVPDRADLDSGGATEADRLVAEADRRLATGAGFTEVQAQLAAAVQEHLARAHARRAELAQIREESAAAQAAVMAVLDEAEAGGAALDDGPAAVDLLTRLAAAADAGDVAQARSLCEQAQQAGEDLARDFDRWLDQLDRTRLVFDAVTKALPKTGLRPLADTFQEHGTGVSIRAERADGSAIDLAILPDEADLVQIQYHADGADFIISETAAGTTAECPDTEEMLERFHAELATQDVATGELRWEGKPATRPDEVEAKWLPGQAPRSRERL